MGLTRNALGGWGKLRVPTIEPNLCRNLLISECRRHDGLNYTYLREVGTLRVVMSEVDYATAAT